MTDDARRALMIAAARTCLGTRFRHQGRQRTHGLDCLGLIVVAAKAAGLEVVDARTYARQPSPKDFAHYVDVNQLVSSASVAPGSIGVFDFGAGPQHVALFTPKGMIHAYAPARKVVEHGYSGPWPGQLCDILSFPTDHMD